MLKQNWFQFICIALILIGWTWVVFHLTQSDPEPSVLDCLANQIKENNYKLDWVEKVLVSAQEEKEALLKENEDLKAQLESYLKNFVSVQHWTREPGQVTVDEDWPHQVMPETSADTSHERFKEMAAAYWLTPGDIWEVENHYGLTEWMILCIAIAETSGWKKWAGVNNVGNVGNTDSNPRGQSYSNLWASLDAIWRTLNNGYLGWHTTLWCLSNAGSCKEPTDNGKRYASSDGNRERNMSACLWQIYNKKIDPSTFLIRNR